MMEKYFQGTVPEPATKGDEDASLAGKAQEAVADIRKFYNDLAYHKVLTGIWELVDASNQYIDKTAPWNLVKTDEGKERLKTVMYNAAESLRVIAVLIYPFMPDSAKSMMQQLGIEASVEDQGMESVEQWGGLQAGAKTQKGPQLFPRMEDKQAEKILIGAMISEDKGKPSAAESKKEEVSTDLVTIDEVMKIDLRTGKILAAEKVKKSKKLMQLKVDIGTEVRQVVAGIAESYEPDQLVGRTVILVANLKPAKLMGIESQGMLLAGTDNGNIVLAGFDQELSEGVRVR